MKNIMTVTNYFLCHLLCIIYIPINYVLTEYFTAREEQVNELLSLDIYAILTGLIFGGLIFLIIITHKKLPLKASVRISAGIFIIYAAYFAYHFHINYKLITFELCFLLALALGLLLIDVFRHVRNKKDTSGDSRH